MRPTSSQPTRLFATAKTHKFTDTKQININNLKLRPVIDQTRTHLYDSIRLNCLIFKIIGDKRIYDF